MPSLSLVQQCILPENWPFFRSKTNDYTAQCLTHGNAFLRLYVNDYNYNKSYLGTCISRLVPLIAQQQYILPRDVFWNLFSLANLVPKLSPDICLGKGPNRTLTTLRDSFYLFSTTSWEIYKVPLKLLRQILFLSPSDVYIRSFLWSVTLHKALNDWNLSLVPELTLLQRLLIIHHKLSSWGLIGEPKDSYTKILQGPNKAYADFLTRLETAISHSVTGEETKIQLEKLLAYENANQKCQRAITPIRETRTVIDYLKACRSLGSETQKIQMLAETMAAAFKKGNEGYFADGDKTHLKKCCPKKHAKKLKLIKN